MLYFKIFKVVTPTTFFCEDSSVLRRLSLATGTASSLALGLRAAKGKLAATKITKASPWNYAVMCRVEKADPPLHGLRRTG